jgi:hypothetical protein
MVISNVTLIVVGGSARAGAGKSAALRERWALALMEWSALRPRDVLATISAATAERCKAIKYDTSASKVTHGTGPDILPLPTPAVTLYHGWHFFSLIAAHWHYDALHPLSDRWKTRLLLLLLPL